MSNGSTPLRSIRIDDDFWAEVKTATSAEGIHVSDLIRGLLREWLDSRNGNDNKQGDGNDRPHVHR